MSTRCRFAEIRTKQAVPICAEPFRILFPLGILASLIGVSLWPMAYAGWLGFYPGEAHARLMVEGFVGGFAMGFIGTAFPKMIGSPSLTIYEFSILAVSLLGCIASHAFDLTTAGDAWFLFAWIFFLGCLATRLAFLREDLPPPGFVLVGIGIGSGIVGVTILLVGRIVLLSLFWRTLGLLLLYEGMILGPILGVGAFLLPRFFHDGRVKNELSWKQRALTAAIFGLAITASYIAQAAGLSRLAPVFRGVLVGGYILGQVRVFHRGGLTGSLSFMLRIAIGCLILGILVSGFFLPAQIAVKHLLFIGGYGLLILTVASRVTWGHAGRISLAEGSRTSLRMIVWIVMFAMATRVVAGFIPQIRVSHHIYASLLWLIAVAIWSWAVLRFVRMPDPDEV